MRRVLLSTPLVAPQRLASAGWSRQLSLLSAGGRANTMVDSKQPAEHPALRVRATIRSFDDVGKYRAADMRDVDDEVPATVCRSGKFELIAPHVEELNKLRAAAGLDVYNETSKATLANLRVPRSWIDAALRWRMGSIFVSHFKLELSPSLTLTVLPTQIQIHPQTNRVLNVNLLVHDPSVWYDLDMPLMYMDEDKSPGLRRGGSLMTIFHTIPVRIRGRKFPGSLKVTLAGLDVGHAASWNKSVTLPPKEECEIVLRHKLKGNVDEARAMAETTYKQRIPLAKIVGGRRVEKDDGGDSKDDLTKF